MSSAAQDKAFDLSGFLGSMFGSGQDTPEASNEFGVGSIDKILDTQLKTQALAGQQASQQAYNDTAAANNLGKKNALFMSGIKQQESLQEENRASRNQPKSAGSFTGYSDYHNNYVPVVKGSPYAPRVEMVQRPNAEAIRDNANFRRQQQIAAEENQRARANADLARYNQQILNTQANQQASSLLKKQLGSNKEIAQIDAQARLASAQLGMQGQILGGLFSSVGSGSPNYRYW